MLAVDRFPTNGPELAAWVATAAEVERRHVTEPRPDLTDAHALEAAAAYLREALRLSR